jgi:hypothetical protein
VDENRGNERNGSGPGCWPLRSATAAADPKLGNGSFFPVILKPCRRIDQALYAVVMEAYVKGISTCAVDNLVAALGIGARGPNFEVQGTRPSMPASRRVQGGANRRRAGLTRRLGSVPANRSYPKLRHRGGRRWRRRTDRPEGKA